MITLQEIRSHDEFVAQEPEWRALEAAGAASSVFLSWPWQRAWLDHWGAGGLLRTLVFHDWREVVGIAPLIVRRTYGLPLRRLQWIGTGVSDHLDLLVRPGYETTVLRAFLGHLSSRASRHWDVADLQQVQSSRFRDQDPGKSSQSEGEESRNLERGTLNHGLTPQSVAPYLPLPETVEALHAQFGKKLRGNLRYALRALERDHRVEFAQAGPEDLDREMDAFFDLHARRWRSRWQPGVLFSRKVQRFHRQAARGLLEDDALRLHALRLDGRTVASLYCFAYGGVGYYYLGGFDPDLSRSSVGTVLTAHAMESAVREGCREFDFLRGQEPYKYRWGCVDRTNHRLILPGRGVLAACSTRALLWEQAISEAYEKRAHGGG